MSGLNEMRQAVVGVALRLINISRCFSAHKSAQKGPVIHVRSMSSSFASSAFRSSSRALRGRYVIVSCWIPPSFSPRGGYSDQNFYHLTDHASHLQVVVTELKRTRKMPNY